VNRRLRRGYLKIRKYAGMSPFPEEQLGLAGWDVEDKKDRTKVMPEGESWPINLRDEYPVEIRNQGRTNRCGGFAGACFLEMLSTKLGILSDKHVAQRLQYSANDLYYFARRNKEKDGGVYMRDRGSLHA